GNAMTLLIQLVMHILSAVVNVPMTGILPPQGGKGSPEATAFWAMRLFDGLDLSMSLYMLGGQPSGSPGIVTPIVPTFILSTKLLAFVVTADWLRSSPAESGEPL